MFRISSFEGYKSLNINISMEDKYYKTTNFNLSIFLFSKNIELVNIDKTGDDKKSLFVFVNSPELQELERVFNFGQENDPATLVDARKIFFSMKKLKNLLYDNF